MEITNKQWLGLTMLLESLAYMADIEIEMKTLYDLDKEERELLFSEVLKRHHNDFTEIANTILATTDAIKIVNKFVKDFNINKGVN